MRIGYLDCSSGVSGDMLIGAIIDAGVSPESLVEGFPFEVRINPLKVKRGGVESVLAQIEYRELPLKRLGDFLNIIKELLLSDSIKKKAIHIINDLFNAESAVHGIPSDELNLHELGSLDTIIDIVCVLRGFELLNIERLYVSPLNLGKGFVKIEDGLTPVPAPATLRLLQGFYVYSMGPHFELTTPTGSAIIKNSAIPLLDMPVMRIDSISYGAGFSDLPGWSNVLRLIIGEIGYNSENLYIIETGIDDMNPEIYEHVMDKLLKEGAIDVYLENIIMKKSRPGVKLTVLSGGEYIDKIVDILFRETTTLGVRFHKVSRAVIEREIKEVDTSLGKVRVKLSRYRGRIIRYKPEYEDLKRLSGERNIPVIDVQKILDRELSEIT